MTDKVDSAIYYFDRHTNKVNRIRLQTFLNWVNSYSKDSVYSSTNNKTYFALKPEAIKFRKEYNKQLINT